MKVLGFLDLIMEICTKVFNFMKKIIFKEIIRMVSKMDTVKCSLMMEGI